MTKIRGNVSWVIVAGIVVAWGVSSSAYGADRFVATTGTDGANDCASSAAPCRSLAHGLAQAGNGDTIKVAGGSYVESLLIDFPIALTFSGGWARDFGSRDLRRHRTKLPRSGHEFRANGGETVDVDLDGLEFPRGEIDVEGAFDGAVHVTVNDCRFSGWTIRASHGGTGTLDLVVAGSTFTGSDPRVPLNLFVLAGGSSTVNVTVQESTFATSHVGSIFFDTFDMATSSLAIDGSTFVRNRSISAAGAGAAIRVSATGGSTSVAVTNSFLARNTVPGPRDGSPAGAGGAVAIVAGTAPIGVTFVNDTIVGNRVGGGGGGGGLFASGNVTVGLKNVILWNNGAAGGSDLQLQDGAVANADHDDIGVSSGPVNDLGGNVSVDPQLVGGFELASTSPLIDAGTCVGAPSTDIEGDPRPSGAGCDIGADEFVP
jgi:hypothetical protein